MTTKVSMMRDDKARFGKVASFLWSQGGRDQLHLGQGLSEPLHVIQFCLYKLCRVGKEARNLFTGEIHPIYNLDGSPRVMAHIQFHALKDHQCSGTVPAPARFPARWSTGMPAFPVLIVPCSGPSLCGKRRCIILIRFPSRETGSSRASSWAGLPINPLKSTPFSNRAGWTDQMDSLVKGVMAMMRLDVEDRKISNLSLREAAMLGFSEDTTHPIRLLRWPCWKVEIPEAISCCQFSPWRAVCSS